MNDEHRFSLCQGALAVLREAVRTGLTCSKDLGARLGLAPGTIDRYFSDAIHALGVGSRADVVLYAVRAGLGVEPDAAASDVPDAGVPSGAPDPQVAEICN